jgi:hypothetical protein
VPPAASDRRSPQPKEHGWRFPISASDNQSNEFVLVSIRETARKAMALLGSVDGPPNIDEATVEPARTPLEAMTTPERLALGCASHRPRVTRRPRQRPCPFHDAPPACHSTRRGPSRAPKHGGFEPGRASLAFTEAPAARNNVRCQC